MKVNMQLHYKTTIKQMQHWVKLNKLPMFTRQYQSKLKLTSASFLTQNHILTHPFKCCYIMNSSMLLQNKMNKEVSNLYASHSPEDKYMQASSHRFANIFKFPHNIVYSRSQRYFQNFSGVKGKVMVNFGSVSSPFQSCDTLVHLLSISFRSYTWRLKHQFFIQFFWQSFCVNIFTFQFQVVDILSFFIKDNFLYFCNKIQSWVSLFFLYFPLRSLSSIHSTTPTSALY